jgi:hypothetical protein
MNYNADTRQHRVRNRERWEVKSPEYVPILPFSQPFHYSVLNASRSSHLPAQRSEQTISQTELQPQLTAAAKSDLERTIYYFHNGAVNCWRSDDCPGLASVDTSAPEQPR